jgi:hypothetical protein
MFLYVVDAWVRQGGNAPTATRPWQAWHSAVKPSEWIADIKVPIRPLFEEFRTPALALVHWSYLTDKCGGEAETKLRELITKQDELFIIVVSGGELTGQEVVGRLYFRKAAVTDGKGRDDDDPFKAYFCEFFAKFEDTGVADFSLLEPEPPPIALMRARTAVSLGIDVSRQTWQEAQEQCGRIIARGDGYGPFVGPDFGWLAASNWHEDFLRDDGSRNRFVAAVSALLQNLRDRQGAA